MLVGLNKVIREVLYYCSKIALQVWDFKGRDLKSRWEVGCSLVKIVYHRVNGNLTSLSLSRSLSHTHRKKEGKKKLVHLGTDAWFLIYLSLFHVHWMIF